MGWWSALLWNFHLGHVVKKLLYWLNDTNFWPPIGESMDNLLTKIFWQLSVWIPPMIGKFQSVWETLPIPSSAQQMEGPDQIKKTKEEKKMKTTLTLNYDGLDLFLRDVYMTSQLLLHIFYWWLLFWIWSHGCTAKMELWSLDSTARKTRRKTHSSLLPFFIPPSLSLI